DGSIESDCIRKHNLYRNRHGTPALKYSESIAEEAQKLAVTLAKQATKKVTKGIYDVNYFIGDSSVPRTISDAVENWYTEGNSYNYKQPEISSSNTRFLELMWKSHEKMGCGMAVAINGANIRTVVVAIYEPAGMRVDINDYIENILPAKD
ncbi:hypothetical protein pdam_00003267, partial [Pocillopora damicornis]